MSIDFNFFDELPKDWKCARVKNILDYNHHYPIGDGDHGSIKPEMYQDDGIPYLRVQNLSWGFDINYDNLVYISEEVNQANNKSILIPKDILIAKTGATVGKMAIIPKSMKQANTTSSVGKVTVNHKLFNHKYFAYLFASPMFQEQIKEKAYQKSAQPGFNIDDLVEFNIIIPPLDIQNDISSYLDKKTSKIDTTIAKNKELISLLEEKRTTLINQVVTKGLNPEVPMKDSGIEWIGEIPEHWDIRKFNHISNKIVVGYVGSIGESYTNETGIPLIKTENIKNGKLNLDKLSYVTQDFHLKNKKSQIKSGDIIIARHGESGRSCVVPQTVTTANTLNIVILQTKKDMNSYYYSYLLNSFLIQEYMQSIQGGAVQGVVNTEDISFLKVHVPPLIEQNQIVNYLDKKTSKIDETIIKIKENIGLLEEYKTSLIHHVVTGKIDVRGEEI